MGAGEVTDEGPNLRPGRGFLWAAARTLPHARYRATPQLYRTRPGLALIPCPPSLIELETPPFKAI